MRARERACLSEMPQECRKFLPISASEQHINGGASSSERAQDAAPTRQGVNLDGL